MKYTGKFITKYLLGILALGLVAAILLPGCAGSSGTVGVGTQNGDTVTGSVTYGNTNIQGGLTGSYDVNTGEWSGGLTLTFTKEPGAATQAALQAAGAVSAKAGAAVVYTLAKYDDGSEKCRAALISALADGAVVTRN